MSPPPDRPAGASDLRVSPAPEAAWVAPYEPVAGRPRTSYEWRGRRAPLPSAQVGLSQRRRWPRRVLITTNVIVAIMLIGAGSVYGYANWRLGQIKTVFLPHLGHVGGGARSDPPGSPITILVVGSDSRAANTGADAAQFGSAQAVTGARSDTIMLLHIDPKSTKASLMSIPRDLWVPIPGKHYQQRINTTFDSGPDLLVQAVEQDLGIKVDHFVAVDFQSFRQVVNAVGGIKEYFPTPARDAFSNLRIPAAGCYSMNGDMALSFVRARHYEYYANGRWHFEAESDLARIKRQQSFIKRMLSKAQGAGLTNPLQLNQIIGGITHNLTIDTGFKSSLMLSLARRFRSLAPDSLPTATLPTTNAVIQGNDVLVLQQPQAQQVIASFLQTPQPPSSTTPTAPVGVSPSQVRASVLNGSGRPGEAGQAAAALRQDGFSVPTIGSANSYGYTTSTVRYRPGAEAKAQLVASVVKGGAQLQPDSSIVGADVVLITGQSFRGIGSVSTGATPSTTAAPTPGRATTPPTTVYELPGTPQGFRPPAC